MSDSGIWAKLFDDTDKKFARNRNVLTYTVICSYMLLSVFVLARYPCDYMRFTSIPTMLMMIPRYIHYIRKRWFLYLFDYCYLVNFAMAYISFTNETDISNGTFITTSFYLAINAYRYQNSLVLHSQETFFTCYMHINPTLAGAALYLSGCINVSYDHVQLSIETSKWYLFYALLYFPFMFLVIKPFWVKYKIPNMVVYHGADPFFQNLYRIFTPPGTMFLYQYFMIASACAMTYFMLRSKDLFLITCILLVSYTVYRAGTYYIDYMPAMAVKQAKKTS